jgi:hypothetical protein
VFCVSFFFFSYSVSVCCSKFLIGFTLGVLLARFLAVSVSDPRSKVLIIKGVRGSGGAPSRWPVGKSHARSQSHPESHTSHPPNRPKPSRIIHRLRSQIRPFALRPYVAPLAPELVPVLRRLHQGAAFVLFLSRVRARFCRSARDAWRARHYARGEASWQILCGRNLSKDILVSDQVWLGVSVSL